MSLSRLVARPLLSSAFVLGAVNALRNSDAVAAKAEWFTGPVTRAAQRAGVPAPSNPKLFVQVNAGLQLLGSAGLITGRRPRLSAALLAVTLVPTTLAGHRFWDEETPAGRDQQRLQFAKNASLLGGLIIAAGDTDGKPGLAWRAGHAAKDARRQARALAKDARREAKLARAKLG
ncbi:MAG: DoxX family membrane protein [Nocardioides sp.]|uniref:DoxX family protein n=1 Tax=Nocardioides sp. TaxID=35761 RepID=UPI0039E4E210